MLSFRVFVGGIWGLSWPGHAGDHHAVLRGWRFGHVHQGGRGSCSDKGGNVMAIAIVSYSYVTLMSAMSLPLQPW